jgi:hypothetical protein
MAASLAKIAYGSKLEVETAPGSGSFTEIAEIKSVSKPNASVEDVDVTHMSSPGLAKEFIPGLTDFGEISFDVNWVPGSATDQFLEAWRASGLTRAARVTYPGNVKDTFPAYIKGYEAGASAPGDVLAGSLSLKVAGLPVRS